MPPEELETALEVADILDGELPHWHKDVDEEAAPAAAPFGPDFELELADSRLAASPARSLRWVEGEEEEEEEEW